VLGHLAGEEAYNQACLDGTIRELFARLAREGAPTGFNGFNEWCVRQRRGLPVTDVLAEWREANEQTRRRMRERGSDGTTVDRLPEGHPLEPRLRTALACLA
jgi:hypothetical protein